MTWYDSNIIKIEDQAPNVKRFWLQIQSDEPFQFKAGQFVTMDLPISQKRLKRWRSYSIANPPDGTNTLEFCISRFEGGAGTTFFFEEAKIGTPIKFKGPDGAFYLKEPIEKDLVFLCTGTGVVPFRSILQDIQNRQIPHQNIHLIFGTRQEQDILYRTEFEQLTQTMPGFRYDIALSRQPDWQGHKGHIHQIYTSQYPARPNPNLKFYLCGWSAMIDEAVAKLMVEMGYDRTQIIYELYG